MISRLPNAPTPYNNNAIENLSITPRQPNEFMDFQKILERKSKDILNFTPRRNMLPKPGGKNATSE
jgi:hypothetical protein